MFQLTNLKETDELIFSLLSSKHRSEICSVSKYFHKVALFVSKNLSKCPQFYENAEHFNLKSDHQNTDVKNILCDGGDYHLLSRLKVIISLKVLCEFKANTDIIDMIINQTKKEIDWDEGFNES